MLGMYIFLCGSFCVLWQSKHINVYVSVEVVIKFVIFVKCVYKGILVNILLYVSYKIGIYIYI